MTECYRGITCVFDPENVFENILASILQDCTKVPVPLLPNRLTEEVLIFDPNLIDYMVTQKFPHIYVLNTTCHDVKKRDNVTMIDFKNFYSELDIKPGNTTQYLCELALMTHFDSFNTNYDFSRVSALDFLLACAPEVIPSLLKWDGITRCEQLMIAGSHLRQYEQREADRDIRKGSRYVKKIGTSDVKIHLVNTRLMSAIPLARTHLSTTGADIVILYHQDKDGFHYTFISLGDMDVTLLAGQLSEKATGNKLVARFTTDVFIM